MQVLLIAEYGFDRDKAIALYGSLIQAEIDCIYCTVKPELNNAA